MDREIPLELGIQTLRQMLDAVDYAHRRESPVIHRDIKPSNILMSQPDYARLADFGIAKIIEPTARATPGTIAGTPEYMAPEQSQGGVITPRADIYAIGVVLYQLLTGRLPFLGPTPWAIIDQHIHAPVPSVRVYKPALAPVWDEVIQRCLAKQPQDRYPSARALDRAIQDTWEQMRLTSTDVVPYVSTEPSQLFDSAIRAQSAGNWPRVIALCGQILEMRPGDAQAVQLLQAAHQALEQERRGHEIARLLERAEVALGAEQFEEAHRLFQAALERQPGLPAAKTGLERVQGERRRAALYYAARADMAATRWEEADSKLAELAAAAEEYRDITTLQAEVQAQLDRLGEVAAWYEQGCAASRRRSWVTAIAAFERVMTVAPHYRDAEMLLAAARAQQQRPAWRPGLLDWVHAVLRTKRGRMLGSLGLLAGMVGVFLGSLAASRSPVLLSPEPPTPVAAAALLHSRVYVVNNWSDSVSVVDPARNAVLQTIPVESRPAMAAVNRAGTRVYVTNHDSNSISVIDTATNTVVASVPVGIAPFTLAVLSDDSRVYVGNQGTPEQPEASVMALDSDTNTIISTVPVRPNVAGLVLAPNGTRVYIAENLNDSIAVIDTVQNAVVGRIPVGSRPTGVAINPAGTRIYVANSGSNSVSVISTANDRVVTTVPLPGTGPSGMAVNPTGTRIYVANEKSSGVSVVDTASNAVLTTVPTDSGPFDLKLDADGSWVYVATYNSGSLTVIDGTSNTVLSKISVGANPLGVAVKP